MEEIKKAGEEKLNLARANKSELMTAYKELLKKYQDACAVLPSEEKQPAIKPAAHYKAKNEISETLHNLRAAIDSALREIETKLAAKFEEASKFDEQIAAQQLRLKDLYAIEREAGALWSILESKSQALRLAEAESEQLAQRRKRDEEDYQFSFELQKRKNKEALEEEKKQIEAELELKRAEIAQKEKDLAQRQNEFDALKKQTQEFPSLLEKEKQALETRLRAEAKNDKDTILTIARKDFEAQKSVLEARAANLEAIIAEQKLISESLREQLKAAQCQVQEVVLKSIEGASGAKTLEAVNRLAHEQIRSNNPN